MQTVAIVLSFALTAVALAMLVPAVRRMVGVIRRGQPAPGRSDHPGARTATMFKETFLHTRMLQWHWVGIMHWFVYMAFLFLSTAVLAAYFQLFKPDFAWPLIGHWYPYEWFSELIGALSTVGIVFLIIYRQRHHPRSEGRGSRFFGSTFWQAYFVEALALLEGSAILFVRAAEWKLDTEAGRSHYPISSWIGDAIYPTSAVSLENLIYAIAAFKIALAMIWLMVLARNITMGIAWHRFTAWPNIWFKREPDGRVALGAMKPLTSGGKVITLDDIDELDEDASLGAGTLEDFSWKGILDFTTCTECGRCQSQCPAWNTEKPLSPKLLIMGLRDHAYAKVEDTESHSERVLVGSGSKGESAGAGTDVLDYFYNPVDADFVIDEDVLWSCTSCGACVQQCPVDIEHVDHIMDMRRYQLLVESNFPAELNQLFKGLENKGNPWNMSPSARMDWAKGLDFDVPVVGEDLESLESVDWLFWVGCAGAYEDRAKKTTRAVAELLNIAGISFGVLGNGETCTGDPARRAGNEFVYQGLAQQNVETFREYKVKKVVSTCAHCFNTLKNEYKDLGIELEVVHHTQLLNRLVRDGKLTPVKDGAGAAKRSITYHDPCYLGRHNQVYSPPRELLQVLPGAEYVEMERHSEKSFCCGAGGARMWMEENLGERINVNRTKEAVGTGADQIAVGCPFCRVMLSDGLTAQQANGEAREEVEVLDVAQMLLASVKGESATKIAPGAKPAPTAVPAGKTRSEETRAEPQGGDDTQTANTVTDTEDVGPLAKASGGTSLFDTPASDAPGSDTPASDTPGSDGASGTSLFDTPADPAPEPAPSAPTAPAAKTGGSSLFDLDAPAETPAETPVAEKAGAEPTPAAAEAAPASGGSLFDIPAPADAPASSSSSSAKPSTTEEAAPDAEPVDTEPVDAEPADADASPAPTVDLGAGGSLFDIAAPQEGEAPALEVESPSDSAASGAPVQVESPSDSAASGATPPVAAPSPSIPDGGSLFDIAAPEPQAASPGDTPAPIDTPAPTDTAAPTAEPAAAPEPGPQRTASEGSDASEPEAVTAAPTTGVDIGSLGSLFDLESPAPTPSAPTPAPAPDAPAEETVESEPATAPTVPAETDAPSAPAKPMSGADLSRAATSAAPEDGLSASADPESAREPEHEPEQEDAPASATPSAPASTTPSAPAHTPRTDADITEAGSLFDL